MVVIVLVFTAQVNDNEFLFIDLLIIINIGADIDTLCVFPKHVEREHFFTIMYDMLKERPEVTEISVKINMILIVFVLKLTSVYRLYLMLMCLSLKCIFLEFL